MTPLVRGILTGIGSLAITFWCYPLGYFKHYLEPRPPDPACPRPPVLLIHGLYHNPSAWILFRRRLNKAGYANLYTFGYSSWNSSFFEILSRLEGTLEQVSNRHGGRRVILLGHSLGGLLARACIERKRNIPRVAAVITLGTPHQGSRLAGLGVGRLARSLVYRGKLIEEMERRRTPNNIPCTAILTPMDNMVFPKEALRVPFPGWEHIETLPVSHVWLLYDRHTAEITIRKMMNAE